MRLAVFDAGADAVAVIADLLPGNCTAQSFGSEWKNGNNS